jgi:hypothetical protein
MVVMVVMVEAMVDVMVEEMVLVMVVVMVEAMVEVIVVVMLEAMVVMVEAMVKVMVVLVEVMVEAMVEVMVVMVMVKVMVVVMVVVMVEVMVVMVQMVEVSQVSHTSTFRKPISSLELACVGVGLHPEFKFGRFTSDFDFLFPSLGPVQANSERVPQPTPRRFSSKLFPIHNSQIVYHIHALVSK